MSERAPERFDDNDAVRVSREVGLDPASAFEVFTAEIGSWWTRGKDVGTGRAPRRGTMKFEGKAGGRLLEVYDDGEAFVVGRIEVWEPGRRLVFEFRQGNFAAHERTEVEVCFEPSDGGTRVRLEHRGLSALPVDHGARHGLGDGAEFCSMMAAFWDQMLGDYARPR